MLQRIFGSNSRTLIPGCSFSFFLFPAAFRCNPPPDPKPYYRHPVLFHPSPLTPAPLRLSCFLPPQRCKVAIKPPPVRRRLRRLLLLLLRRRRLLLLRLRRRRRHPPLCCCLGLSNPSLRFVMLPPTRARLPAWCLRREMKGFVVGEYQSLVGGVVVLRCALTTLAICLPHDTIQTMQTLTLLMLCAAVGCALAAHGDVLVSSSFHFGQDSWTLSGPGDLTIGDRSGMLFGSDKGKTVWFAPPPPLSTSARIHLIYLRRVPGTSARPAPSSATSASPTTASSPSASATASTRFVSSTNGKL